MTGWDPIELPPSNPKRTLDIVPKGLEAQEVCELVRPRPRRPALPRISIWHFSPSPLRDAHLSSPTRVSVQLFKAIETNDCDTYLSCCSHATRAPRTIGSFGLTNYDQGREQWRKYKVTYRFLGESEPDDDERPGSGGKEDAWCAKCELLVCRYQGQYGKVPGYDHGETVPRPAQAKQRPEQDVAVYLMREPLGGIWGADREWRVYKVEY